MNPLAPKLHYIRELHCRETLLVLLASSNADTRAFIEALTWCIGRVPQKEDEAKDELSTRKEGKAPKA